MNKKLRKALGIYAMVGEYFSIQMILKHGCSADLFFTLSQRRDELEWKLRWIGKIVCRLAGIKLPKPERNKPHA